MVSWLLATLASILLSSAHDVHDLDPVFGLHRSLVPFGPRNDRAVACHRDPAAHPIDARLREQLGEAGVAPRPPLAVERERRLAHAPASAREAEEFQIGRAHV